MGVLLEPAAGDLGALRLNWWTWRTIVDEIGRLAVVPPDRPGELHQQSCGHGLDAEEARLTADAIRTRTLPRLGPDDRLLLDGAVTAEPDDGTLHREDWERNYSATADALERFAEFCDRSGGFVVS